MFELNNLVTSLNSSQNEISKYWFISLKRKNMIFWIISRSSLTYSYDNFSARDIKLAQRVSELHRN